MAILGRLGTIASSIVDPNTVLLLHCDGTDASTSFPDSAFGGNAPQTGTATGNTQVDTAFQKFGSGSMLLDGGGDYYALDSSSDFDFAADDFTMECWVRVTSLASDRAIMGTRSGDSSNTIRLSWLIKTDGTLAANIYATDHTQIVSFTTTASVSAGTWSHVCICRSGSNFYMGIDGTVASSSGNTKAIDYDAGNFNIGSFKPSTPGEFVGHIDEVRVTNGLARYTSNYTVPTSELSPYL